VLGPSSIVNQSMVITGSTSTALSANASNLIKILHSSPILVLTGFWKINMRNVTEDYNPISVNKSLFNALFQAAMANGSLAHTIRITRGELTQGSLSDADSLTFNGTDDFRLARNINIEDVPISIELNQNTFSLAFNHTELSTILCDSPI
jgi:hypothetical protein